MRTAALLALLALAAPASGGQTLAELAERHLAGDSAALDRIAGWSRDDVRRARNASGRIEGRWPCAAVALLAEDVRRQHRRRTPAEQRVRLGITRELAASAAAREGCGAEAARPLLPLLVGLASLAEGHLIEAIELLSDAADRHPSDAALLTAHASALDAIASLREFEPPPGRRPVAAMYGRETLVESTDGVKRSVRLPNVTPAALEGRLRKAIEADPDAAEARLRLGCVLARNGAATAAIPELERARGAAESPRQGYLARLCLGQARELSGDLEGAEHDYVAAAGLVAGGGQSAWLGAARAARSRGAGASAQAHLERALQVDTADPWLDYPMGQPERRAALAAELIARLRP